MIVLAYDHRAFELMQKVKKYLISCNVKFKEYASENYNPSDNYAEFACNASKEILKNTNSRGIFSCRTGTGVAIMANRFKGIRAGVCSNKKTAFLGRNDDDLNVLVLPAEKMSFCKAKSIINTFIKTNFEGGRHLERVEKYDNITNKKASIK